MRILVVGIEEYGAVSKILSKTLSMIDDNSFEFICFGRGKKNKTVLNNMTFITKNPHSFSTKVVRKIYKIFNKDYYLLSWRNYYRQIKRICKKFDPDVIVAASGFFFYMKAAYEFAKRNNKRLILMFFDPFKNNSLIKNKTKAIDEASKWCSYADSVLYDCDGDIPISSINENKFIPFFIPIFESKNSKMLNNSIVYGGMFYSEFREPDALINLINNTNDNVIFDIYTERYYANIIKEKTFNKAKTHPLLGEHEFDMICDNCLAIVAIGNGKLSNTIPSKLLEAIGHKKPILGMNFCSKPKYLEKYPFFYDCNKTNCIKEIMSINNNLLKSYDIFYNFPERDPSLLTNLLVKIFKQ